MTQGQEISAPSGLGVFALNWLASPGKEPGNGRAVATRRDENSPAFQCRVLFEKNFSPTGTMEGRTKPGPGQIPRRWFSRPAGTDVRGAAFPALKRRAIVGCPFGTKDDGCPGQGAEEWRMEEAIQTTSRFVSIVSSDPFILLQFYRLQQATDLIDIVGGIFQHIITGINSCSTENQPAIRTNQITPQPNGVIFFALLSAHLPTTDLNYFNRQVRDDFMTETRKLFAVHKMKRLTFLVTCCFLGIKANYSNIH